jgi:hypothetical protein
MDRHPSMLICGIFVTRWGNILENVSAWENGSRHSYEPLRPGNTAT